MHESIVSETARNEVVVRDYEVIVARMYCTYLKGLSEKDELTLDEVQQFGSQAKVIIEGLDMFNNKFNTNLSESVLYSLEAKRKAYVETLKALISIHEVYEEVIMAYQPAEDQNNAQDIEREKKQLRESQRKENELQKKLKDIEKLVIDLLQEQSNKSCVTCLSADANIALIPCVHVYKVLRATAE